MRKIKYIVVHCTGTHWNVSTASIRSYWRQVKRWRSVGYHILIDINGKREQLADFSAVTNGVAGYNSQSIHVCYKGGVKNGRNVDTRSNEQKVALLETLKELKERFPDAEILGHRDFPNVRKDCPCFDAKEEYKFL
jgi:N-acetylmuramoyl-L-alanine amidase